MLKHNQRQQCHYAPHKYKLHMHHDKYREWISYVIYQKIKEMFV
jgi:hypothetical protein